MAGSGDPLAGVRRTRHRSWLDRARALSLPWFRLESPPLAGWYHWGVPLLAYLDHTPEIGPAVELAADAFVVGAVRLDGPAALESSAVLRGDQNRIQVGPRFRIGR